MVRLFYFDLYFYSRIFYSRILNSTYSAISGDSPFQKNISALNTAQNKLVENFKLFYKKDSDSLCFMLLCEIYKALPRDAPPSRGFFY